MQVVVTTPAFGKHLGSRNGAFHTRPDRCESKIMEITDFTESHRTVHAITELREFWEQQGPDGHIVSDIVDANGHQYVDVVMEGGGVLGIALLGYTYALETVGIRFLGVGGTSAGAIVSTMIAALDDLDQAKSELALQHLGELEMFEFVDGDEDVRDFIVALLEGTKGLKLLWKASQVIDTIQERIGLNPGDAFLKWAKRVLRLSGIRKVSDLHKRFNTLPAGLSTRDGKRKLTPKTAAAGLKIVASDVTTETKAVFPEMADLYFKKPEEVDPAKFIRASMSIPLFFEPFRVKGLPKGKEALERWGKLGYRGKIPPEIVFADGGIMSNFPIDLFHDPTSKATPLAPTFGARLGSGLQEPNRTDRPFPYLFSVFNAARHCNDVGFLTRHPDFQHLVTYIPTGSHNWLNFFLGPAEKLDLFENGVVAAVQFLKTFNWQQYKTVRKNLKDAAT